MKKQQALEMWWSLFCSLRSIPNDYRSRNHTAYINEAAVNIYDLVNELDLNQEDWNTDNTTFLPLVVENVR